MRIIAKVGQPARIQLTNQEGRVLAQAEEICKSIGANSTGDLKEASQEAAERLGHVNQYVRVKEPLVVPVPTAGE